MPRHHQKKIGPASQKFPNLVGDLWPLFQSSNFIIIIIIIIIIKPPIRIAGGGAEPPRTPPWLVRIY
jgi:hypothetical protein